MLRSVCRVPLLSTISSMLWSASSVVVDVVAIVLIEPHARLLRDKERKSLSERNGEPLRLQYFTFFASTQLRLVLDECKDQIRTSPSLAKTPRLYECVHCTSMISLLRSISKANVLSL